MILEKGKKKKNTEINYSKHVGEKSKYIAFILQILTELQKEFLIMGRNTHARTHHILFKTKIPYLK